MPAHPFAGTSWTALKPKTKTIDPKNAELRDLRLTFTETTVTVIGTGSTRTAGCVDEARETGERHFALTPAHPILGEWFSFWTNDADLRLTAANGMATALNPVEATP